MIHLGDTEKEEDVSLCGAPITGGSVLTYEVLPYNRTPKNICLNCKRLYDLRRAKLHEENHKKYHEYLKNRTFKDRLKAWANVAEGSRPDFDLGLILMTGGTILIGKHMAKFILKVFYNE